MGLVGKIFSSYNNSMIIFQITLVIVLYLVYVCSVTNLNIFGVLKKCSIWLMHISSKLVHNREMKYHRDLEIGKINEHKNRVKFYKFLNDLIIDLGLKAIGATPYEFLFLCILGSLVISIFMCEALFGSLGLLIIIFPTSLVGLLALMYTRANVVHDTRIEDVIISENILCSNIKEGIIVSVRVSLDVLPKTLRDTFSDFLDNVEHKNYHIVTALMELNQQLGSISDEFIKKCIVLETEEKRGIVGGFKDHVTINNIRLKMRTKMKRKFEVVVTNFIIGTLAIFVFLCGVLFLYRDVSQFYFTTKIGQIIIAIDLLLVTLEFVIITYLKAQDLKGGQ